MRPAETRLKELKKKLQKAEKAAALAKVLRKKIQALEEKAPAKEEATLPPSNSEQPTGEPPEAHISEK